jgi:hypothetical protein
LLDTRCVCALKGLQSQEPDGPCFKKGPGKRKGMLRGSPPEDGSLEGPDSPSTFDKASRSPGRPPSPWGTLSPSTYEKDSDDDRAVHWEPRAESKFLTRDPLVSQCTRLGDSLPTGTRCVQSTPPARGEEQSRYGVWDDIVKGARMNSVPTTIKPCMNPRA